MESDGATADAFPWHHQLDTVASVCVSVCMCLGGGGGGGGGRAQSSNDSALVYVRLPVLCLCDIASGERDKSQVFAIIMCWLTGHISCTMNEWRIASGQPDRGDVFLCLDFLQSILQSISVSRCILICKFLFASVC